MSVPKYRIRIWPTGQAEPDERIVVLPRDEFGTVSADLYQFKIEIESNKADGQIDKYEIVEVSNTEIDLQEATNWLQGYREQ